MKKLYSKKHGGEAFALDAVQLDILKKAGYTVPSPEEVIADAAAVKIKPPESARAYVVFDFKTGAFAVRTRTQTLTDNEVGGFVGEVVSAAIKSGGKVVGYSDTVVYVRLHENGCYVPCDEAEAGGFCIKPAIDRKDEETGETTTYLEDFVYAFTDGGLLGIEPVGSVENVSGTLMLAENDKVLDILLGGAAE